jgi:cysteine desulfurase family protein (TIGR01976 family)
MYTVPGYDIDAVRSAFPSLRAGAAHFESPGGTQTPEVVAQAIYRALTEPLSNRDRGTQAERNADDIVHSCRDAIGDLLGVEPATVVFGRSATSLTFELSRTLARTWKAGDEIIVSRLDHDANVRPWVIAAARNDVTVKWADFDPATGELEIESVTDQLSERTRVVAMTAASNLIGTMPDLATIAGSVHETPALLYVDGVHHAAHCHVDVPGLGADLYVCSPYKFLGPHCAVLTARPDLLDELAPDKLLPSSNQVPERFELGTLPYEVMAGTSAAVDFLASLVPGDGARRERLKTSMRALGEHEDALRARIEQALKSMPGVTCHSRARVRTPTLLFTFSGRDPAQVSAALAELGINAPSGAFYAEETAKRLGLGRTGGLRVGLAPYNNDNDVDRLLTAVADHLQY